MHMMKNVYGILKFFTFRLACIVTVWETSFMYKLNYIITNSPSKPLSSFCARLEKPVRAFKVYQARLSSRIKSALQNETYDPRRNFRTCIERGIYELLEPKITLCDTAAENAAGRIREKDAVVLASGYNVQD